jgi:beta-galactosidase/beta-glucuronidase
MIHRSFLLCLITCACAAVAEIVVSLDTAAGIANWTVSNANGTLKSPAEVPGSCSLDLLRAGVIGEPYAELYVDAQHWIADEPVWTYEGTFSIDSSLLQYGSIELVSLGIDTVANVSLNGEQLWSQRSAFARNVASVRQLLVAGTNTLRVDIASPNASALANAAACPTSEGANGAPPLCPALGDDGFNGTIGFNYLRKPAVHFGWDFAGNFLPSGIWQPISLRAYNAVVIDHVTYSAVSNGSFDLQSVWATSAQVYVTSAVDRLSANLSLEIDNVGAGGSITIPCSTRRLQHPSPRRRKGHCRATCTTTTIPRTVGTLSRTPPLVSHRSSAGRATRI